MNVTKIEMEEIMIFNPENSLELQGKFERNGKPHGLAGPL